MTSATRIALVHEWLSSRAGSEKTFEQMAKCFEDADLFALTMESEVPFDFDRPVATTALQRSAYLSHRRSLALPLMPAAWRMLGRHEHDVVVTSSHAFSRYFAAPDAVHLCYVHSPLRYAWLPAVDGRGSSRWLAPARSVLKWMDHRTVGDVQRFAGNSTVVAERIQAFYGREASIIFPPVDVDFYSGGPSVDREGFVLGFSRWIPYKRLDLVIAAAELVGKPAVIAGSGPSEAELREAAGRAKVPVEFVENPSDTELRKLYRQAAVLVFPAEEDFGIVPVEAQAAGTPVVALARGGSLDTVIDGWTGALVAEQTPECFAAGIRRAERLSMSDAAGHVSQFSVESFRESFTRWVEESIT